jgi:hypothetical protein
MSVVVLTIAGTAKTLRRASLHVSYTANGRATATFDVISIDGTYRPPLDAEVIITEDGTRIFGGLVDKPREKGLMGGGGSPSILTAVNAIDFNAYAERRYVNETLAPGTLKSMLTTLVANYLVGYGVTLDAGQVNGPTLPELDYDNVYRNLTEVFNELATLTGKYGEPFVWHIDAFKVLSFVQPSTLAAPFNVLTNSPPQVLGDIEVEHSREHYANRIILKVPEQRFLNSVDTFTGDSVTSVFTTTYEIAKNNGFVVVTPGGFMEPLGDGHPTGPTWTIDPDNQTLTRLTGALPTGYTANITYDGLLKVTVTSEDAGEIGSVGIWEKVVVVEKVPAETTAQALADGYLAQSLSTPKTLKYRTLEMGLRPGQIQTFTVPRRNLSTSAVITDVVIRDFGKNRLVRDVTAMADADSNLQKGWRDVIKQWSGDKTGASVASGGTVIGAGQQMAGYPGLPFKSVQFNDSGFFGGHAQWLFDKTTVTVMLGSNHVEGGTINLLIGDGHTVV